MRTVRELKDSREEEGREGVEKRERGREGREKARYKDNPSTITFKFLEL